MQAKEVREILVREVMSSRPRTGRPDMTVKEAAALMLREGVGSLIVLEGGEPVGILTERDILYKVVAVGKVPSRTKVERVMSSPVITIAPGSNVSIAAKRMSDLHMRRLPVVENGKLIGMLTEKDILKLSPSLIELTREWANIGAIPGVRANGFGNLAGYCEGCDSYSIDLGLENGSLLCPDCREE
ncbi:MAG TPA: CBS domain-containing protein [Methanomassiliicoccales archaeon]|nr:CBS domain-containing protein [Methanomassiliicoccales archaeon]